jgi:hypothetical protein
MSNSASSYTERLTNRVRATAFARAKADVDNGLARRYQYEGGSGGTNPASAVIKENIGTSELTINQFLQAVASAGTGPSATGQTQELVTETFTSGSTVWRPPFGVDMVEYLLVGGGGGGGGAYDNGGAGGGGGGQVLSGTIAIDAIEPYQITIGNGGAGGTADRTVIPYEYNGSDGVSSQFGSVTALGGVGGYPSRSAPDGARAGGSAQTPIAAPTGGNGGGGGGAGGGGGGAGAAGTDGVTTVGGAGGIGITSTLSGSSVIYGIGGLGGSASGTNNNGTASAANIGQGGAGGGSASSNNIDGRDGGSGIVVIRYYKTT